MSQLSNFSENYENFNEFEILSENLQSDNEESKNISKLEEIEGIEELEEIDELEEIKELEELEEIEEINEFPNEAYGDLMKLVIENNLSNKAGNAVIKFFNKHSNLSVSPLPKNIESGRKLIDKMNKPEFTNSQHLILIHNNKEYFIYYQPIKNCIQNLLSNLEISRHLVYNYENIEVKLFLEFLILIYNYLIIYYYYYII
jgi:hypothetical protein